jgi:iron complex transport system ATP-binding protein
MIGVEKLTFRHRHAAEAVVRDISFTVDKGTFTALLGPNGCGKTTLFKCIAGLWRPESGRVILDGHDISTLSYRKRASLLSMVPQEHVPPFPYSVCEAVLMGRAPHIPMYSAPAAKDEKAAMSALDAVGISHLGSRSYTRISGGERQLVLIARALAQEAPLVLLDEPTSHLDFRNQHLVLETMHRVAAEKGLTVLTTLHDPNLAASFARRIIMLRDGMVIADGEPEHVMTETNLVRLYNTGIGISGNGERKMFYPKSR